MYEPRIMKELERFASLDMRLARKEGRIIIATRNKGRADLNYTDGVYKLIESSAGVVLYEGRIKKDCREALINLYEVVT